MYVINHTIPYREYRFYLAELGAFVFFTCRTPGHFAKPYWRCKIVRGSSKLWMLYFYLEILSVFLPIKVLLAKDLCLNQCGNCGFMLLKVKFVFGCKINAILLY